MGGGAATKERSRSRSYGENTDPERGGLQKGFYDDNRERAEATEKIGEDRRRRRRGRRSKRSRRTKEGERTGKIQEP